MIRLSTKVAVASRNDATTLFLEFFLAKKDFQVEFCDDLRDCLHSQQWELPDLFILDHNGDESCVAMCKQLRRNPRRSAVPILVLVDKDSVTERDKLFAAGADDVLQKPFSADHLSIHINSLLFPSPAFCAAELSSLISTQHYFH